MASPVPLPCKNSITSTRLHPTSATNFATHFMGRNMCNVYRTLRAMIGSGLPTIWTRYDTPSLSLSLHSSRRRLSIALILPVPLPGSVYASSETRVVLRGYSQHPIRFLLGFWSLIPNRSPEEATAMYTRGPSMVQRFVSNVCGYMRMLRKRPRRCVIDALAFPVCHHSRKHRPSAKKPSCGNV
jgi:hypothetical protein